MTANALSELPEGAKGVASETEKGKVFKCWFLPGKRSKDKGTERRGKGCGTRNGPRIS